MKKCSRCTVEKSLDSFQKNGQSKDGYSWMCRDCQSIVNEIRMARYVTENHKYSLDELKQCTKCFKSDYRRNFGLDRRAPDMRTALCPDCMKIKRNINYYKNRDKILQRSRDEIDKSRARNKKCLDKKIALGLCKRCAQPKLEYSVHCLYHWVMAVTTSLIHRLDPELSHIRTELCEELLDMLNSTPVCPYTNEKIIPGLTASLDHKIPVSRDKSLGLEVSNLEWTSIVFNQAKGNMTTEEFLHCYEIKSKHNFDRTVRVHMRKNYKWG